MVTEYAGTMQRMYACFIPSLGIFSCIVFVFNKLIGVINVDIHLIKSNIHFVLSEVTIYVVRIMSTMQFQIDVKVSVEN